MKKLIIVLIMILGIFTSCEQLDEIDQCGIVTNYDYSYGDYIDQWGNSDIFYYVWLDGNKHQVDFATFNEASKGDVMCIEYK